MARQDLINKLTEEEYIKSLMAVAEEETEELKRRSDVGGIFLYGSLARGEATVGSDVDLVVVLNREIEGPEQFERHLRRGIRVDLSFFGIEQGKRLAAAREENILLSRGFLELVLAGDFGKILYDPTGELEKFKASLLKKLSSPEWVRQRAIQTFQEAKELLQKTVEGSNFGDQRFLEVGKKTADAFAWTVCQLALTKDLRDAAQQLQVPEVYDDHQRIDTIFNSIYPVTGEEARRIYLASKEILEYSWQQVYEPLKEVLAEQGVEDIDKLRLWSIDISLGEYTFELKRVIKDACVNLDRAGFFLSKGGYKRCVELLPPEIEKWWKELASGLEKMGYSRGRCIVVNFLNGAEFRRCSENLRQLKQSLYRKKLSQQEVESIVFCAQHMKETIEQTVPSLLG